MYRCNESIYHGGYICFTKGRTYILRKCTEWNEEYYYCEKDDDGDRHEIWFSQVEKSFTKTLQPINKLKKHKLGETCEKKILEHF